MAAPQSLQIEMRYNGKTRTVMLTGSEFVLGRSVEASVVVECQDLSRRHLKVELRGGQTFLTDLGSTNGTFYRGVRMESNKPFLYQGGEIRLGTPRDGVMIVFTPGAAGQGIPAEELNRSAIHSPKPPARPEASSSGFSSPGVSSPRIPPPGTGGSGLQIPRPSAAQLHLAMTVEELEKQKRELESQIDTLYVTQSEAKASIEAKRSEEAEFKKRISALEDLTRNAEKEFEKLDQTLKYQQEKHRSLEEALKAQIGQVEQEMYDQAKKLDDLSSEHEREREKLAKRQTAEFEDLEIKHRTRLAELNDAAQLEERMLIEANQKLAKKLALEREAVEAETRLKEAQTNKIIEELRTRVVGVERELEVTQRKVADEQKSLETTKAELAKAEAASAKVQGEIVQREARLQELKEANASSNEERSEILTEIVAQRKLLTELKENEENEKRRLKKEVEASLEEARRKAEELERETDKRVQEKNAEADKRVREKNAEAESFLQKAKQEWEKEASELRSKAKHDQDEGLRLWSAELQARRQKDMQDLQLWKAEEEKSMHERLTNDVDAFVARVTDAVLVRMKPVLGSVDLTKAAEALSLEMKSAITGEAQTQTTFNPSRKVETQKFWMKSVIAAGIAAAGIGVMLWLPKAVKQEFDVRKSGQVKEASDLFMKRVMEERRKRLELRLENREAFQETYVDNVLYNVGYLLMKEDKEIQEEWTLSLNKLFTKELGLREDAIVEYMPVESALVRELAEKRKHLNAVNKDAMIPEMQLIAQSRMSEMLQIFSTRTMTGAEKAAETTAQQKWDRVRDLEREFYAKKLEKLQSTNGGGNRSLSSEDKATQ